MDQWQVAVNTAKNFRVLWNAENFFTVWGGGLLGSQEGLCCVQLILARGVSPVTARLVVVTLTGRVIGWLLHAVSCLMKCVKYWHECAEILAFWRTWVGWRVAVRVYPSDAYRHCYVTYDKWCAYFFCEHSTFVITAVWLNRRELRSYVL